jgi:nucleoside-diphosphate-sugar epimerase
VTAVITGSNGFSAFYLSKFIKKNTPAGLIIGIDVSSENRNSSVDEYFALTQFEKFTEFITKMADDMRFFHLGGLLGQNRFSTLLETNVLWTSRYLEVASRIRNLQCFLNVGSSAEYGRQEADMLTEDLLPKPINNYGISKHLQTQLVLAAGRVSNIPVVCTRTFNLIGPGLGESLVVGKILREFKEVGEGSREKVELGRMDSRRDFIDVRDAVRTYWLLSDKPRGGEVFNVASGRSHEIREVFSICSNIFGFSPEVDQKMAMPLSQDVDYQYADISKLRKSIAVDCDYSLEVTLRDMIDGLGRD